MPQITVPPEAEQGYIAIDSDGCMWRVESTPQGGDPQTEVSVLCIGTYPHDRSPCCPHLGESCVIKC